MGEIFFHVKFLNMAPETALPDLFQLCLDPEAGQEAPSFISFTGQSEEPLREAFGVPEGTSGRAQTIQTGLFMTGFKGALADGFAAERIHLHQVGRRSSPGHP